MEEKLLIELEETSNEEYKDEEFYETIEAPKFVDFTTPNHFCPDDRYWFCSRVGCNQLHEEEMDSEAIYKNFVLRVMAARSPNIRFRRALSRQAPSEGKKCPFSAPPKPSKSRIPRLALISSFCKKLVDDEKGTIKGAAEKPVSTPKARVKQVAAKYMTSPRMKKRRSPNPTAFRSVRNPKMSSITIQKSKVVAKALVFNSPKKVVKAKAVVFSSPKKAVKAKASEELATPITKLCEGVKKLAIVSEKKCNTQKPLKGCSSVRKLLPSEASRKRLSVKPKAPKDILPRPKILKESSAKSSRCKKGHQNDMKHDDSFLNEVKPGDDSSDMEIEDKSKAGSLESCSGTTMSNQGEKFDDSSRTTVSSNPQEEETSSSERPLTGGSSDRKSSNTLTSELISIPDSDNSGSGGQENSGIFQEPDAEDHNKENKVNAAENDLGDQNREVGGGELLDMEDKENGPNSGNIRNMNGGSLKKHDAAVKTKVETTQTLQKVYKALKENCPATVTQPVKYKKLKTTNPKPFRLRTDERGILKEATLERKAHSNENPGNTNENTQCMNGASETKEKGSNIEPKRKVKRNQFKPIKSKYRKNSNEVEANSDRRPAPGRTESPLSHKLATPQSVPIKSATSMLKPKESRQRCKDGGDRSNKTSRTQKLVAPGKRPVTIPREPKFHTAHKTKALHETY